MKSIEEMIKNHQLYPSDNSHTYQLRKDIIVGHKVKISHVIIGIIIVIFVSLFLTGFGYQPWWITAFVIALGIFITLPVCFYGYWQINKNGIKSISYSSNGFEKLLQLLNIKKRYVESYPFSDIKKAEINYIKILRISPFDFNPDYLKLDLILKDQVVRLGLGNIQGQKLTDIVETLNIHGIDVYDKQQIVQLLKEDKNLFEHFHRGKWASL